MDIKFLDEEGDKYDKGITKEEAHELMLSDIKDLQEYLDKFLHDNSIVLNQHQYDALISFTFLAGISWLVEYTDLRNILTSGNITYEKMHREFMEWLMINKKREKDVYRRRMDELDIFFYGAYKTDFDRPIPDWFYDETRYGE